LYFATNNNHDEGFDYTRRISKVTGEIQVSKNNLTNIVPCVLLFGHGSVIFTLMKSMDDELEADINGLLIYLGLGYPRI